MFKRDSKSSFHKELLQPITLVSDWSELLNFSLTYLAAHLSLEDFRDFCIKKKTLDS